MKKLDLKKAQGHQGYYQPRAMGEGRVDASRVGVLRVVFGALVGLVMVRVFFLQAVEGEGLRERGSSNRIMLRRVMAPRGVIRDRRGEVLVVNEPRYELMVDEEGRLLLEPDEISRSEALEVGIDGDGGVVIEVGRRYLMGELLAAVVGYVGEADETEVASGVYELGDVVGKSGVEKAYDMVLAGRAGSELVEVDASGRVLRRAGWKEEEAGEDVGLGIDLGLQKVLNEEMEGLKGAVVASDPYSGEVLAMVSMPSFDPNVFSGDGGNRARRLEELFEDEERPLLNRVIGGTYPPGSVFKVVPAVAGLEGGVVGSETEVEDTGELRIDEYRYGNWYFDKYGRTEGLVDMVTALKRSNDIYFYKLGEWLGVERLAEWSERFGLGRLSGVDLPGEVAGLVPNEVWKERVVGERWFLGNTYHFAIGQGDLLVTPLQLNQMMGVVANGGRWCKPRVVVAVGSEERKSVECRELGISESSLSLVRQGLVAACERGGTGFPFFDFDLSKFGDEYEGEGRDRVACKTGTAQFFDPDDRTHAWFSVFAPAVNPEVLVTVLVEGGGEGSEEAAPIARKALEYWFGSRKQ